MAAPNFSTEARPISGVKECSQCMKVLLVSGSSQIMSYNPLSPLHKKYVLSWKIIFTLPSPPMTLPKNCFLTDTLLRCVKRLTKEWPHRPTTTPKIIKKQICNFFERKKETCFSYKIICLPVPPYPLVIKKNLLLSSISIQKQMTIRVYINTRIISDTSKPAKTWISGDHPRSVYKLTNITFFAHSIS